MSTHPVITPTCADHRRRWHDLGERGWPDHAALEYPHGHRVALGEGGMRRSEVARRVAVGGAYLLAAGLFGGERTPYSLRMNSRYRQVTRQRSERVRCAPPVRQPRA